MTSELLPSVEPARRAPAGKCQACAHPTTDHDQVARRWCASTTTRSDPDRRCVCHLDAASSYVTVGPDRPQALPVESGGRSGAAAEPPLHNAPTAAAEPPLHNAPTAAATSRVSSSKIAAPETFPVHRPTWQLLIVWAFLAGPVVGLVGAVVLATALGVGPSRLDIALAVVFYAVTGHGITVGFHRLFTHGSFTANRGLRIALAVAGSMAVEGPVIHWVADHRRHHAHSDAVGDPHSPWRFGTSTAAVAKGLGWAHMG